MPRECGESKKTDEHGIPVEDARLATREEVRKKRHTTQPLVPERHAADEVAKRGTKHHGQKRRRQREDRVAELTPQGVILMGAELDRHAAQNQQPEHQHQRQIKAGKRGGVDLGESQEEHSPRGDQPYLVAVPDRPDRGQHGAPLVVGAGDEAVHDADPKIKAVQHRINREHCCDDRVPNCFHENALI